MNVLMEFLVGKRDKSGHVPYDLIVREERIEREDRWMSTPATNPPPAYQSNRATNAPSTYQFSPATKAPPAYESTPAPNAPSAYQSNHATNAPLTYQFAPTHLSSPYQFAPTQPYHQAPTINHSPIYESSPTSQPTRSRGRVKNKCFWEESETELLIEVLQDMTSDPSWKTNGGFRSNYLGEVHRRILAKRPDFSKKVSPHIESKVKWLKTKFHIINDMLKQSGCSWNDVEKKIACERQ
nr:myb/SANT-like domain-containing protein [Tanacetum cinerariifolium]